MLAAGDGEDGAEGAGREGAGEAERLPPGEGEAPPLAVPQSGCEAEGAQLAERDAPPLPLRAPLWLPLPSGRCARAARRATRMASRCKSASMPLAR